MTSTNTYADYEAAIQASAMLKGESIYVPGAQQDPWVVVLRPACSASSGIVTVISDYGPILPHVGSSSFIVDCRPVKRALDVVVLEVSDRYREVLGLSVVEQLQELLAALSLNKSQLAQILRVTRPTIYDWFHGKDPNATNTERLHALLRILVEASVSSASPLNGRFVRQPTAFDAPSLVDLLGEESIDDACVMETIRRARMLAELAARKRTTREERLRDLGFEDPSSEQRREQLAKNVALQDWPKR